MELDKEVFKGKKLSDLVEEVYNKHKNQDTLIKQEISRLADMIESPGDAIVFDRRQLHCTGTGAPGKIGVTVFTNLA